MEPLVVRAILQSKLVVNVEIPDVYPQVKVVQKSLVVDSSPKLTNKDWIREQSEDSSIGPIIRLFKTEELCCERVGSIWYACSNEVSKRLVFEGWVVALECLVEKPPGTHFVVCVTT